MSSSQGTTRSGGAGVIEPPDPRGNAGNVGGTPTGRAINIILLVILSGALLSVSFPTKMTADKEPIAFPLQPGSIGDKHIYQNNRYITIPFVRINNIPLTIDFPTGVYFPQGDITNHNNTYVPTQPESVDCIPTTPFLNQEGWAWSIPHGINTTISDMTNPGANIVTKANSTGMVAQWMMPNGTIRGYEAGVFYNPVNFYQNDPSDPTKYMFFQVDYGVGKLFGNRTGWIMTFEQGGSGNYAFIQLNNVTVAPGSKYWIAGVLEPSPLAQPPAYVVQIIHGTHSWVYETEINDIDPKSSPVYKFQSFQDQWISTPFASNLTRDEISYPTIISIDNNNNFTLDSILNATNYTSQDYNIVTTGSFHLLSPHLITSLLSEQPTYTDSRDCQGFGNPSNDTNVYNSVPASPLKNGKYTIAHTPVPEFGPLVGVIAIVSVIAIIAITRRHPSFRS